MAWLSSIAWVSSDTPVLATVLNNIGNDIRTSGGDHDNAGYSQLNCASIAGPAGATAIAIKTNGSERMRVSGTGLVGIGITSPADQLSLGGYGAIGMLTGNATSYVTHQYLAATGQDCLSLATNYRRTDAAAGTIFVSSLGTAEIEITSSGVSPAGAIYLRTGGINTAPSVRMSIDGAGIVSIANLPAYANNSAATTGGLVAGNLYSVTSSNPRQVAVVF